MDVTKAPRADILLNERIEAHGILHASMSRAFDQYQLAAMFHRDLPRADQACSIGLFQ
ncbi:MULTISPECIES: hypothetical protein [Thiorhodovibrio]|uniref:hypothetical protein n=1 Tax=Thiorhodovibrio TaxID=61593 RepID=UPI001912E436|nr:MULTISPECIES: hypothetical protein [Thiorhodovibrio]